MYCEPLAGIILLLLTSSLIYSSSNLANAQIPFLPFLFPNNNLELLPWGDDNNLELNTTQYGLTSHFTITGTTGSEPSGFITYDANLHGETIILNLTQGKLEPETSQASLTFNLVGDDGQKPNVRYVMGPLEYQGWINDTLYQSIHPGNAYLLPLDELTQYDGYHVGGIEIVVSGNSTLDADFSITTEVLAYNS